MGQPESSQPDAARARSESDIAGVWETIVRLYLRRLGMSPVQREFVQILMVLAHEMGQQDVSHQVEVNQLMASLGAQAVSPTPPQES